jgi:hypothetical protein
MTFSALSSPANGGNAPRLGLQIRFAGVFAALTVLVTALLLSVAVTNYVRTGGGVGGDFLTDYAAGYLVRTGDGDRLYDLNTQAATEIAVSPAGENARLNPFVLPPAAAWMFAPLSLLPFRVAHILFTAANIAALLGAVLLLRHEMRGVAAPVRNALLLAFVFSMPVVTNISWGQIDLLLVYAALLGWRCLRSDRDLLAGAAFSLALMKPHFLVGIVLLMVLQRRWKTLGTLAAIGGITLVPAALALGNDALTDYGRLVLGITRMPAEIDAQPHRMANWRGFVVSMSNRDELLLWLPGAAMLGGIAMWLSAKEWRRDACSPRSYALAVTLPLLLSPHVHMQSMMLLFVAVSLVLPKAPMRIAVVRGWSLDTRAALLFLVPVLFVGYFLTATVLAVMFMVNAAVFVWCAVAPRDPAQELVDTSLPLAA